MSKLVRLTFLISLFLIFLLPSTDPDLGWQLRCGQLFWQKHPFCEQNQFSILLENYSWPNHAWGYQAVIYPIWSSFGKWGLSVFNAVLMTSAFYLLYSAIKNFRFEKILAILLTIYLGWGVFSFGIRSQLVGFFFFNLTLYILSKLEEKPKLAFSLPLATLLWANSHGSVILGLILILYFILRTAIVQIKYKRFPILISLLSALATLINPFGFHIHEEAWRHFAGPIDLSKLIAEWVPPVPSVWWLVLLSGLGLSLYFLITGNTKDKTLIPLTLLFTYWALKARRNVPFYFSLMTFLFLTAAKTEKIFKSWLEDKESRNYLTGLLITMLLIYGLFVQLPKAMEQDYCRGNPCGAIEFLKAQAGGGNIFNRYEWGGFLIWQLPKYKIFVDGRMPAWPTPSGKSPYTIYLETLQTRPGWQETLDNYNIDWILISPKTFMDLLLAPDPEKFGWQEVFRDESSVIYRSNRSSRERD